MIKRLAFVLAWLLSALVPSTLAQGGKEETFPAVDPYTRGDKEVLTRAGYVSFGTFDWGEKHDTKELSQTLGGVPLLVVETAHFKLASTLKTYRLANDRTENEKLELELKRLKSRIPRVKTGVKELDPWLRLHLYAQRAEELYAEFEKQFGLSDEDFPALGGSTERAPYMGEGPHLGQKHKFTLLITEKNSTLGRYTKRYFETDEERCFRAAHKTGGWTFCISAESRRSDGREDLDAPLHCAVVEGLTHNLLDGFRNQGWYIPPWFKLGLAHRFARRIDERFQLYGASQDMQKSDEEPWIWEPRVWGLVNNKFFARWKDTLAFKQGSELDARANMVVWSRVCYLLQLKEGRHREFLMALSDKPPESSSGSSDEPWVARQVQALETCYGMEPEPLEAAWAKWVLKTYPKK